MKQAKVEIIIPVYNTPQKDLRRCIESLKAQTYSNWAAILVDDGSSSEIADYLDVIEKEDYRIRIFHKKNEGVSIARNYGINKSSAPFITFVDSDDCIFPNFLEEAVELLEKFNLDMVIGGVEEIGFNNQTCYYRCNSSGNILHYDTSNKEVLLDYMLSNCHREDTIILGNAWCGRSIAKLYQADLIKDIKFPEHLKMSEDNIFSIDVILKAKRIGVCENLWYRCYKNQYSAQHCKKNPKQRLQEQLDFADSIYSYEKLVESRGYEALMTRLAMIYYKSIGWLGQIEHQKKIEAVKLFNNREVFKLMLQNFNPKIYIDCPQKIKLVVFIAKIPIRQISWIIMSFMLYLINIKYKKKI